jgi:hypothetical protein
MPAGRTHGEDSSARSFGGTTGADCVNGTNQVGVPANAVWVPAMAAAMRNELRMDCFMVLGCRLIADFRIHRRRLAVFDSFAFMDILRVPGNFAVLLL